MPTSARTGFFVSPAQQPTMREVGLDAESIFEDSRIVAWRSLPDRANCTLDADLLNGIHIRWHIKRYNAASGSTAVEDEVNGHRLLVEAGIPTAPLVGFGRLPDHRGVVIFDDLAGFTPADKLLERGTPFDRLRDPTADLAARLHDAALHHRDLYLCHFMGRIIGESVDLKLIDTARVKRLPGWPMRSRWIVKDLSQFWYSTSRHGITDAQRRAWLNRYGAQRKLGGLDALRRRIERKARAIARHDARLHRNRPERDVSIPLSPSPRIPGEGA
jgi:hypothetical protein